MQKFLTVVLLTLLVCSVPQAHAANRALLIGIGKYSIKNANLPGIEKDVKMMREVALTLGYRTEDITTLFDEQATLANIKETIQTWLIDGAGPDDNVLFYFSGHGTQIWDKNHDETDEADEVLVTNDATIGNHTLNDVFTDDTFFELLERMHSKNVFVLVDACHSGTSTRSFSNDGMVDKFLAYPGMPTQSRGAFINKSIDLDTTSRFSALSAAQDNQRAQASKNGSYFTMGVLQAVRKAATTGHKLTMAELHDQTTDFIKNSMPNPKKVHNPALAGGAQYRTKNIFIEKAAPRKPAQWDAHLRKLVKDSAYPVHLRTNGTLFRIGDALEIACTPQKDGYLNVVTLQDGDKQPTVLFPNKYHPDNKVTGGQTITVPAVDDDFSLTAQAPAGKALVAVFLSPFKVNFYKDGFGEAPLRPLTDTATRGFVVIKKQKKPEPAPAPAQAPLPQPQQPEYGAGLIMLKIR